MRIQVSIKVDRPPEIVWPVLVDVERWPEWTASISEVHRMDRSPLDVGSVVRIRQPRLQTMRWRVTEFQKGRYFIWETRSPGVLTVASHVVREQDGGSIVDLTIDMTGWLSPLAGFLFGKLTRRYMEMEARGLKRRAEALLVFRDLKARTARSNGIPNGVTLSL
jgi:uncharacterized membrane protein